MIFLATLGFAFVTQQQCHVVAIVRRIGIVDELDRARVPRRRPA
jgi:hypothetical protein